jgi:GH15 family glucan-1,4-alpha-glucosidase
MARGPCRSCTESTGAPTSPRRRSGTCTVTEDPSPCGSATAHTGNSSSISMESCSTPSTSLISIGGDALDAALLIMPLVLFISPADPRMLATLDAVMAPPESGGLVSNSLVYRYNLSESADGLSGEEGTFNICTFWLVEALTRAGRVDRERLERARLTFEQMLGYGNHLGLFAEQTGRCGEALGNYPQAFTHLALISAAFNLDRAFDRFGE